MDKYFGLSNIFITDLPFPFRKMLYYTVREKHKQSYGTADKVARLVMALHLLDIIDIHDINSKL